MIHPTQILSVALALLLLAGLLVAPNALADPEAFGTSAGSFTIACITAGCPGGGTSPTNFDPGQDNAYGVSASSDFSSAEGSAEAHANLLATAGLHLPVMTGQAAGSAGGSTGRGGAGIADSTALNGYFYDGPSTTVTITGTLTGTFSGPTSGQNSNLDGIFGDLYLFTDEFAINEINFEVEDNDSAMLGCLGECYQADDQIRVTIIDTGSTLTGSFDLDLDDGDSFVLYARFSIGAAGGGTAVSMSSFEVSVSSTNGLTSLVPEPASGLVALLAAAGVALKRRSREI